MDNLSFNNYKDFACDIADKCESIKDNEYNDVAVVAKYEEAKQIIKELLCIGYDLYSIEMHDVEWGEYDSEYIVCLYDNEIWCEPMLQNNGYITDASPIMYVLDNCSSRVIPYCKGKTIYEVSVGNDNESNTNEIDNSIDTNFKEYKVKSGDDSTYDITIKCNLDMGEAEKFIENIERRVSHINEIFDEMNRFRELFRW